MTEILEEAELEFTEKSDFGLFSEGPTSNLQY